MAAVQYVFVMQNLTKVFPGGKELFKGITLSFLPGAKIGVLGVNGAGKSTLLKIMAGVDKEFNGEAWAADGVKVGYLEQEPQLDPKKNVMENIMDGLGETRDLLKRFEEVSMRFGEEMTDDEMNDLINEQAELQEKIDAYLAEGYSERKARKEAEKWVAKPNYSEHQLGLALDINADKSRCDNDTIYQWLSQNAYRYGFILRYPEGKEDITGIDYEPWHYRYVGKGAAQEIQSENVCLEEYLEKT